MDKKGQEAREWGMFVAVAVLITIFFLVALAFVNPVTFQTLKQNLGSWFGGPGDFLGTIIGWLKEIGNLLITLIAPSGFGAGVPADKLQDYQVIAVGVFFLLFIVGEHGLGNVFKNRFYSYACALLVALIASRALDATIIKQYIIPSPVTAAAFLIGVLPLLMFYGLMQKWRSGSFIARLGAWILLAATYYLVFSYAFVDSGTNNVPMGVLYALVVLAAGIIDFAAPYLKKKAWEGKYKSLGNFIAYSGHTLNSWGRVKEAAMSPQSGLSTYDMNLDS